MPELAALFLRMLAQTRQLIANSVQKLLEEKHLYQSIELDGKEALGLLAKKVNPESYEEMLIERATGNFNGLWQLLVPHAPEPEPRDGVSVVRLQYIKTYCAECKRIEPFAPLAAQDSLGATPEMQYTMTDGTIAQNFVLSYLCQSCRLVPESFLVRRVGSKITLCGRSPMEHVEVPKFIPEVAKKYFSGAIVAHQSGQTLAGLFLLRTAIEQWIYSLNTAAKFEKADQAVEWYMSTLPSDFKQYYPSLRKLYEDLSNAIHSANASTSLFDAAKADIEAHFDARRLRRLQDPKTPGNSQAQGPAIG